MAQELKWTKAKWCAHADDLTVLATDDEIVADVYGGNCAPANAHLIAAAPELYEALEGLFNELVKYGFVGTGVNDARSALSKARGEQC